MNNNGCFFLAGPPCSPHSVMKTALLIDEDRVLRHSLALWLRQAEWLVLEADDHETRRAVANLDLGPSL